MKVAMGLLAVGAVVGGFLQIPKVSHVLESFLEPSFAESRYFEELHPSDGLTYAGLAIGALLAVGGIALAYALWVKDADRRRVSTLRARLAGVHAFFARKWYFDELIDAVVVRPFAWFGRFARDVFERAVVNGVFVGGPSVAVRAGSAAVRAVQSGFLRYYAALLLLGVTALSLYFLLSAS
jgi:NADH-quinone oxidoreductase subunit L